LDHIHLIGNHLKFTVEVRGKGTEFLEVQASVDEEKMNISVHGIEKKYGGYLLFKDNHQ